MWLADVHNDWHLYRLVTYNYCWSLFCKYRLLIVYDHSISVRNACIEMGVTPNCITNHVSFIFVLGTIVNLAQNFVGSNNLNLLEPIGQFGTRLHGGKDSASPRYIFTCLRLVHRQKSFKVYGWVYLFSSLDE